MAKVQIDAEKDARQEKYLEILDGLNKARREVYGPMIKLDEDSRITYEKREVIMSEEEYDYLLKTLGDYRTQVEIFAETLTRNNERMLNSNSDIRGLAESQRAEVVRLSLLIEHIQRAHAPTDQAQENERLREQRNEANKRLNDMKEFVEYIARGMEFGAPSPIDSAREYLVSRGYAHRDRWTKKEFATFHDKHSR